MRTENDNADFIRYAQESAERYNEYLRKEKADKEREAKFIEYVQSLSQCLIPNFHGDFSY